MHLSKVMKVIYPCYNFTLLLEDSALIRVLFVEPNGLLTSSSPSATIVSPSAIIFRYFRDALLERKGVLI